MKIVILDGYSVNPGDMSWEGLCQLGEVKVYDRTSPADVVERSKGAEILITNKTPLTGEMLRQLPDCRFISILATGYNIVDVSEASALGIVVSNVPDYSTDSVAQSAMALLLTITNHVEDYAVENRSGRWSECKDFCYWSHPLIELSGKLLGIIGYGNIGRATARVAQALGMRVAVYSSKPQSELPGVTKMSMDDIFRKCDVVSLHCPLTPETTGLINKERLEMMKSTAILINTARGGLINEQALAEALNSGKIYAAGLDVLSEEPPKNDNALLSARNCYVTPHISWATVEARKRLVTITEDNVKAFLAGNPINVVS
ncbi:MAG: D-2-hydroxyacid dehydrogenase [Muribaculaceae bacterium]|nr:D-2-hydroxyacid dehydrogenase [Muribaculaceae bacterium]